MQRDTALFGLARCAKDGDWLLLLLWTWTIMRSHWRMNCKGEKKKEEWERLVGLELLDKVLLFVVGIVSFTTF